MYLYNVAIATYIMIYQARSQGGSVGADEPPSEIKGPLFLKKVHYFEEKPLIFYNLKKRSTIYCSVKVLITR